MLRILASIAIGTTILASPQRAALAKRRPPTFCEKYPARCHLMTRAERARFRKLAAALRKAVVPVRNRIRTDNDHERVPFRDLGIGVRGASWWDFTAWVTFRPDDGRRDYPHEVGVSVGLTPLPIEAYYNPGGTVTTHSADHLRIAYASQDGGIRIAWIVVGEIGGEGETHIDGNRISDGPLNDVRSVRIEVVGRPDEVQAILDTLSVDHIRKVIRDF